VNLKKKKKPANNGKDMGLVDHLKELRNRLIIVVVVFVLATVISFNFCDEIVDILISNAKALDYTLVYLAPGELFMEYVRLSVICGIVISSPVILHQIWGFIRPGLEKHENRLVFFSLVAGLFFFLCGTAFSYFVAVPMLLVFFAGVDQSQAISATISVQNYLAFILSTLLSFGIVFELPVIISLLTGLGLLKPEWLVKSRRVVIVIIFIIGAIITPPDVVSQLLVSIPMMILFEFSVIMSRIINRRKIKRQKAALKNI
jgi:sec-independent protein translocase protein TatC